jgi:antitoxin (DNA-binding transcriptional repressor) of toxin-antitoxin stability system
MSKRVSKSVFKVRALELLREVENTGASIIVTDRGCPVIEVQRFKG